MKRVGTRAGLMAALAVVGLGLAACGGGVNSQSSSSAAPASSAAGSSAAPAESSAAPAADCGAWSVAMHAWVGYTASAQVLSDVAREKLGCDITQTQLDEGATTYDAMEAGTIDLIVEDWGGGRWQEWVDRGAVVEVGPNGNVGLIGMYVPQWMCDQYPDISDSANLNKYADLFKTPESGDKGAWLEGPPGYTTVGEKMIEANKLNFKAINTGSEAALIEALDKGIKNKTPVLAYGWEPWYYMANADVCRINFPANDWTDAAKASGLTDYPESPLIKIASTKLMDSGSPFATLVTNFVWTNEDQNQVAADIEGGMSPEEAAKKWIDAHPDVVATWLAGTGAS
ncbi:MAG: glycine betaine ABC transporter substrate-binding protein [Candidatus Nanopelagicales bacterium]